MLFRSQVHTARRGELEAQPEIVHTDEGSQVDAGLAPGVEIVRVLAGGDCIRLQLGDVPKGLHADVDAVAEGSRGIEEIGRASGRERG